MRAAVLTLIAASVLVLVLTVDVFAQAPAPSYPMRFQSAAVKLRECELAVSDWRRQALLSGILLGAIAVFGGATAVIQGLQKPWTKTATVMLGAIVSTVTVINTAAMDGDFKTLNRRANGGKRLVATAGDWLQGRDSVTTDEDRDLILQEVEKRITAFWQLSTDQQQTQSASQSGSLFEPVAYAATSEALEQRSQACGCLQAYDPSPQFVYFCGTGIGKSLTEAKAAATSRALTEANNALRENVKQTSQSGSDSAFNAYVRRVASEADSCARPGRGQYESAVLLRVARALASSEAQTAFVPAARPIPSRVPVAVGQRTVAASAPLSSAVSIPVRANNTRDGDFVFNFRVDRAGGRRTLVLSEIQVHEDGSVGPTSWTFTVLVNGASAATVEETAYNDERKPPVYTMTKPVVVALSADSIVEVRGYRR
jgi:hypothetical protein